MAAAKKKPEVEQRDDFDAHQFQVMADAANVLPRTARGGARDLTSADDKAIAPGSDVSEWISSGKEVPKSDITQRQVQGPSPSFPTLAEVQERRRYVSPQAPVMDTIYQEPERRVKPAVRSEKARLAPDYRGGTFKEEAPVQDVKFEFQEEDQDADPRARFIDALNGPAPTGEIPGVKQKGEDPRFTIKNGYRFYT